MALPRVTGVVWWEMGISHYKAIFRRARSGEREAGYTKDYLQGPRPIGHALREMFGGADPPYESLAYRWPGGTFTGGKVYRAADYDQNGRVEVGQWTGAQAPHPWRIGDPESDPLITLRGDPDAAIPDDADAQWDDLEDLEPWLVMIQLDGSQEELQLRAYLGAPPPDSMAADFARVPAELRKHMRGRGGLVHGIPDLWFDREDLRDPWRTSPESAPSRPPVSPPPHVPVGTDYKPANESVASAASEPFEVDPNERDRATRAHAVAQNALAEAVEGRGCTPLSPSGEPNFDLAWEEPDGTLVVAEVKSVTAKNVERQLRLGLGQVLRYRNLLEASGKTVRALLVLSDEPADERWTELCQTLEVGLIWLPDLSTPLEDWL